MNKTGCCMGVAAALLMGACSTPEQDCRAGVKDMKGRTQNMVGLGLPEAQRQALEKANNAEVALATGNYEACLQNLTEARAALRRAQGNNQQ